MKRSTPYYFREGKATIWLTAGEYIRLKALMAESVRDGRNPASRMEGFGPPPVSETQTTHPETSN